MDRVTVASRQIDRLQLRRGDHIYAWRKRAASMYSHHGIYESDDKVIQLTSALPVSSAVPAATCNRCGEAMRAGGVVIYCLDCFLGGDELCLFVYGVSQSFFNKSTNNINPPAPPTCSMEDEDPPEAVVDRANRLLARGFGSYDVVLNNCFHFAFHCKTGKQYRKVPSYNVIAMPFGPVVAPRSF